MFKFLLTKQKCCDIILLLWPVGQAVKTPPSHGGDKGSIPLRVTTSEQVTLVPIFLCKKIGHLLHCSSFFVKRHTRLTCSSVKRTLYGLLSLPPFYERVPSARVHLNHSDLPKKRLVLFNEEFFVIQELVFEPLGSQVFQFCLQALPI